VIGYHGNQCTQRTGLLWFIINVQSLCTETIKSVLFGVV